MSNNCIPLISTDIDFRDWQSNTIANNSLKNTNLKCSGKGNGSAHQYRFFLQKNADKIMQNEMNNVTGNLPCSVNVQDASAPVGSNSGSNLAEF